MLRSGGAALTFETSDGAVRSRPGDADAPDLLLAGPPQLIVGLLVGNLSLAEARARGLDADGDLTVLSRLRPAAPAPGPAAVTALQPAAAMAPQPAAGTAPQPAAATASHTAGPDRGSAAQPTEPQGETPEVVQIAELFESVSEQLLASHPGDDRGRMLQSPGLKTAGSFFAFATKDDLVVKFPAARVAELIVTGVGRPCSPAHGRPMRQWVRLRPADAEACAAFLAEARSFVTAQAGR